MRRTPLIAAAAAVLAIVFVAGAEAQQHDPAKHGDHGGMTHMGRDMGAMAPDTRKLVDFPAEVRQHQMQNMREHFQAVSDILAAMGAGQYARAAEIAQTKLGAGSAAATGCKGAGGQTNMSTPDMHQKLAQHMPEAMGALGMTMHRAADEFAAAATASAASGDGKPAYAALARVTAGCIGCHEAYRVY